MIFLYEQNLERTEIMVLLLSHIFYTFYITWFFGKSATFEKYLNKITLSLKSLYSIHYYGFSGKLVILMKFLLLKFIIHKYNNH